MQPACSPKKNKLNRTLQTLRFYTQKRLLIIFCFGIASGFPWVMIGSALSAWLNESGISRSAIGFFGAVYAVYAINFLWSPLVDRIKIPLLSLLGQRRAWILFCQLGLVLTCFGLSLIDPKQHALLTAGLVALGVAIFSATQDIAIDAYRIDSIGEHEPEVQSAAAAMATSGWWTGFSALGSIPFFLNDPWGWSWSEIYQALAVIMAFISLATLVAREPKTNREQLQSLAEQKYIQAATTKPFLSFSLPIMALGVFVLLVLALTHMQAAGTYYWFAWVITVGFLVVRIVQHLVLLERHARQSPQSPDIIPSLSQQPHWSHVLTAWLIVSLVEPLAEFFRRNGPRFALSVLLFLLLFKVGEAFLGRMSIVFYQQVGFTNQQIGTYSKLLNWWVTIVFSLIGGHMTMRLGVIKGLFIGGTAMALSNLFFAALAVVGPSVPLLTTAVIVDGFTSAWATVAVVTLISMMTNRAFTASQYALMASIATLGRTVIGSYSGAFVDYLAGNWALFFILITLMIIPSLVFLWTIRKQIQRIEQTHKDNQI